MGYPTEVGYPTSYEKAFTSKATKQEVTSIVVVDCSTEKYILTFQSKDNE